jgi:hypothetical protein
MLDDLFSRFDSLALRMSTVYKVRVRQPPTQYPSWYYVFASAPGGCAPASQHMGHADLSLHLFL